MFNFFKKKKYKIKWQYFDYIWLKPRNHTIVKAYSEVEACCNFLRKMPLPIGSIEIEKIED